MLADIYHSFNTIALDDTVVSESEMRRGLSEQNAPNRFSDSAIREIYRVHEGKPMNFKTFCKGILFYNRFKVYSDVMTDTMQMSNDQPDDSLNLDAYLALLHDKLMPN